MLPLLACTLFLTQALATQPTPSQCIQSSQTLYNLSQCLTTYIKTANTINDTTWNTTINANQDERSAWNYVIAQLLLVTGNASCPVLEMDPKAAALKGKFTISEFPASTKQYCVFYETSIIPVLTENGMDNQYARGWGFFAINKNPQRHVHVSAAHPLFDGVVNDQASGVFETIGAKSLSLTGQHRMSYNTCYSECQDGRTNSAWWDVRITDPAHDNTTMLHATLIQTKIWQYTLSGINGCPSDSCVWIQFHGMGPGACNVSAMMTVGTTTTNIYTNATSAVMRLHAAILQQFSKEGNGNWTVETPLTSNCKMNGGANIFGRIMNGVAIGTECYTPETPQTVTGSFIHVEQQEYAREVASWANALMSTFSKSY